MAKLVKIKRKEVSAMEKPTPSPPKRSFKFVIVGAIVAAFLLVLANMALWLNNSLFDTKNFSSIATASLTSESSRQAIAETIIDKAFQDRPNLKNVVDEPATKLISSVLGTDRFSNILQKATGKIQVLLTSQHPKSVVINLSGVKNFLSKLIDLIDRDNNIKAAQAKIPSQIVLVDASQLPNFYNASVVVLWVGPISLLTALVLLAYPYFKNRLLGVRTIVLIQGLALIGAGLFSLLLTPLLRPLVLSSFDNPNARIVIDNLYSAFMQRFNGQMYWLIAIGFIAVLAIVVIKLIIRYRPQITHVIK